MDMPAADFAERAEHAEFARTAERAERIVSDEKSADGNEKEKTS